MDGWVDGWMDGWSNRQKPRRGGIRGMKDEREGPDGWVLVLVFHCIYTFI